MLTKESTLLDVFLFQLMGLSVVMVALSSLAGICALLGTVIRKMEAFRKPAAAAASSAPQPAAESVTDALREKELFVVIAAAVAATLKKPHRIITIEPLSGAWSSEGRAQHHLSHRIR